MLIDRRRPAGQTNAENRTALRIAVIALALLVALAVFLPNAGDGATDTAAALQTLSEAPGETAPASR